MYTAAAKFRRTAAERVDQELAWRRSDQAFFAAGACHILGWTFVEEHPQFRVAGLRKVGEEHPSHVIATDGTWAFDHDGWTLEEELLACTAEYEPDQPWEIIPIPADLATFCATMAHRAPHQYYADPRPRARAYLERFPSMPPVGDQDR
jgi:hypothetical protein